MDISDEQAYIDSVFTAPEDEDSTCPICGEEMTWCYSCRMYTSLCCEEFGTCECS